MTASKLKRPFLEELDAVLQNSGFLRTSDRFHGDHYSRRCGQIQCTIHISLVPRSDSLEVEVPFLSVRYDAVEAIVARYEDPHPLLTPSDLADRPTLSLQLDPAGLISGLFRKSWSVRKQEQARKVAQEVGRFALRKGEPTFARLSDPKQALKILTSDDEVAKSYAAPDEMRAKKAIGLALIFEGREAAKQVADVKLARLQGDARSSLKLWFELMWSGTQVGSGDNDV